MFSLSTKPTGRALLTLTVALAFLPATASAQTDEVVGGQDRRSPDTRDAAVMRHRDSGVYMPTWNEAASRIAARQDLRSPDTRDVADGREFSPTVHDRAPRSSQAFTDDQRRLVDRFKRGSVYSEALTAAHQASLQEIKAPQPASATGFDWVAAAAGAAAALGLTLLMTAGVLLVRRRAQREQPIAVS